MMIPKYWRKAAMFHCYRWPRTYAHAHSGSSGIRHPYYESRGVRHGGFGMRRPLRYLSHHLNLDESQRRKLAASFERLKLEREQANLDRKRVDAVLAEEFVQTDVSGDDLRQALLGYDWKSWKPDC